LGRVTKFPKKTSANCKPPAALSDEEFEEEYGDVDKGSLDARLIRVGQISVLSRVQAVTKAEQMISAHPHLAGMLHLDDLSREGGDNSHLPHRDMKYLVAVDNHNLHDEMHGVRGSF
jgi:hypothetical protein